MSGTFTPQGLEGAAGLQLAAANLDGSGADEPIVSPASVGGQVLDILQYETSSGTWILQ